MLFSDSMGGTAPPANFSFMPTTLHNEFHTSNEQNLDSIRM